MKYGLKGLNIVKNAIRIFKMTERYKVSKGIFFLTKTKTKTIKSLIHLLNFLLYLPS